MVGKKLLFCTLLLVLSLGTSAQNAGGAQTAPSLPGTYHKDSLIDYTVSHLRLEELETVDDYLPKMYAAIDQHVPNHEWGQRLKCDITCDILEMSMSSDPIGYLNDYLKQATADSLKVRAQEAYTKVKDKYSNIWPGKPAPDISFTDINGKRMSLKSLRGKILLIDIWGTWCAPCIEEMPFIEKLQQRYAHRDDVHIMSIACDKKADRWKAFLAKHPTSWHQYLVTPEGDKTLNEVYYAIGIPRFIIIDKEGMIITPDALRPSEKEFIEYFERICHLAEDA